MLGRDHKYTVHRTTTIVVRMSPLVTVNPSPDSDADTLGEVQRGETTRMGLFPGELDPIPLIYRPVRVT